MLHALGEGSLADLINKFPNALGQFFKNLNAAFEDLVAYRVRNAEVGIPVAENTSWNNQQVVVNGSATKSLAVPFGTFGNK